MTYEPAETVQDDPQIIHVRVQLVRATAHATAIIRMCQFANEHAMALDHCLECELLYDEGREGIKYRTDKPDKDFDIYSASCALEKMLHVAEIYVAQLGDHVIATVLADPGAYPNRD